MVKLLLSDDIWSRIELLPTVPVNPKGGRLRIPDRACLTGILFVLKTGIPWEYLPVEMGSGSGMTCWRRLRDWQEAGVWDRLHRVLLDALGAAGQIDWERASVDSASIPAKMGRGHRPEPHRSRQTGHEWEARCSIDSICAMIAWPFSMEMTCTSATAR